MKRASTWFLIVFFFAMTFVVGCVSSQPKELVERHDHPGLKVWYLVEAATLRGKAEEMRQMADEYKRQQTNPGFPSVLARHCENLVKRYTKAAEDAEALAKVHAKHPLSGPGNPQAPEGAKLFSF
ncbi:MAG: hypothetical protein NPIRA02_01660 [Nitrospirales bacterium]|nr:MAG: hypothetical protein NPIRA02_01660 [Nitrospirales bacterium]